MKGSIRITLTDYDGNREEEVAEFNFRLRDLSNYFITQDDEIMATIGGILRIFKWNEQLEKEFDYELNKKQ
jgi:hypothetical protein